MVEKPEITAGLKAAVEKGYSLEQAKKSFTNAGYPPQDVEDSSRALMGYGASLPSQMMPTQLNPQPQKLAPSFMNPQQQMAPQIPSIPALPSNAFLQPKPKSSHKMTVLIIILAVVLVLLLGVLGASIFFKEQVIDILKNIGINLG